MAAEWLVSSIKDFMNKRTWPFACLSILAWIAIAFIRTLNFISSQLEQTVVAMLLSLNDPMGVQVFNYTVTLKLYCYVSRKEGIFSLFPLTQMSGTAARTVHCVDTYRS